MTDVPTDTSGIRPIRHFDGTRDAASPVDRLEAVRAAAEEFRTDFLREPEAAFYGTWSLIRAPYPRYYGLREACTVPTPLLHILNRLFVVRYTDFDGVERTLLFSPSDWERDAETPFFKRLARSMGPLEGVGRKLISPAYDTVPTALASAGIDPADVDFISYDHLHTQDVRRWLGTDDEPAYFPNARLLVHRQEWASANGLLPQQKVWYCPDGVAGVAADRIVTFDGSVALGPGVALLHTPGHTEGNHSLAVRTPEGVMVTSENGIGPDSYAPEASRIPGLARYAARTRMEVVMNANTLEGAVDQYLSMVCEKTVAGPSARDRRFPNMVCSSELTAYWAFPGIRPTLTFGDLRFGDLRTGGTRSSAADRPAVVPVAT